MRINADDEESDYALFGMVLLQWGHVEAELVNILLRLTHPLFGFTQEKGLPGAFSDQIRLAKRLYGEIPQPYFSAYIAIVFNAYVRAKLLELGADNPDKFFAANRIQELLKSVLPHQAGFIEKVDAGAYHHLLDEIEKGLLDELSKMLEGAETDEASVKQAATIMEKVKGVLAENTQASANVDGIKPVPT